MARAWTSAWTLPRLAPAGREPAPATEQRRHRQGPPRQRRCRPRRTPGRPEPLPADVAPAPPPAPSRACRRTVSAELARQLHARRRPLLLHRAGRVHPAAPRRPGRRPASAWSRRGTSPAPPSWPRRWPSAPGDRSSWPSRAPWAPPTPPSASTPRARTRRPSSCSPDRSSGPSSAARPSRRRTSCRSIGGLAQLGAPGGRPRPAVRRSLAKATRRLATRPTRAHPPVPAAGRPGRRGRGRGCTLDRSGRRARSGRRPGRRATRPEAPGGLRARRHRRRRRRAARPRHQATRGPLRGHGRARHRGLATAGRLPQRSPQLPGHGRRLGARHGAAAPRGCRRHRLHRRAPVRDRPRTATPSRPRRPLGPGGPAATRRAASGLPAPTISVEADASRFLDAAWSDLRGAALDNEMRSRREARTAADREAYRARQPGGAGDLGRARRPSRAPRGDRSDASCRTTPSITTDAGNMGGWLARGFRFRRAGHVPRDRPPVPWASGCRPRSRPRCTTPTASPWPSAATVASPCR